MTATARQLTAIPAHARCIVYVRVSTEKQARPDKVSPEVQRAACAALAAERGFTTYHVMEDHESGSSHKRFDPLVAFCQAHPQPPKARGLVVCYDTSRLGRFGGESTRMYMGLLRRAGWELQFAKERLSGGDTDGFVIEAYALAAKKYRDDLKQRAHDHMLKYARDEQRWMGRVPFGYARDAATRTLVVGNRRDVLTVTIIFRRFSEGATLAEIAAELNAAKAHGPFDVYAPRPGKDGTVSRRWRACTVRALLANPAYVGTYRWHRRANGPTSDDPRLVRADAEWVNVEGAHEAIIDRAMFDAAQARLHRAGKRQRVRGSKPYLLTGLVTCECGSELIGGGGRAPNRFYKCSGADDDKHEQPVCAGQRLTVNQQLLEQTVIERVTAHVVGLVTSGVLAKTLDTLLGTGNERQARAPLERERQGLEAQQTRIVDAIADGTIGKDAAKAKLTAIEDRLAHVDRELHELRLEPTRADRVAERDRLLQMAADLPTHLRKVPPAAARELLAAWLAGATVAKPARKGADLPMTVTLWPVPAELATGTPARRARGRRCSRAASPRSSRR